MSRAPIPPGNSHMGLLQSIECHVVSCPNQRMWLASSFHSHQIQPPDVSIGSIPDQSVCAHQRTPGHLDRFVKFINTPGASEEWKEIPVRFQLGSACKAPIEARRIYDCLQKNDKAKESIQHFDCALVHQHQEFIASTRPFGKTSAAEYALETAIPCLSFSMRSVGFLQLLTWKVLGRLAWSTDSS